MASYCISSSQSPAKLSFEGRSFGQSSKKSPLNELAKIFPMGTQKVLSNEIIQWVKGLNMTRCFNMCLHAATVGIDPHSDAYEALSSEILYADETYAGLPDRIPDIDSYRALAHEAVALWSASGIGAKYPSGLSIPHYYVPHPDSRENIHHLFKEWLYSGPMLDHLIAQALFGVALIRDQETSPEEKEEQRAIVIRNIGYFAYLEIEALKKDRTLVYAPLHTPSGFPVSPFIYMNLGAATNGPPSYLDDKRRTFENLVDRYLGPESDSEWLEKIAELVIGIFFEGMMVKRSDLDGVCRLDLIHVHQNNEYYAAQALPQFLRKRATDALRRVSLQESGSTYTCPSWCNGTPQAYRNGSHLSNAKSAQHQASYRQAMEYYTKAADLLDVDFSAVLEVEDSAQSEALMTLVYAYLWYAEINDTIGPDCEVDVTAFAQSLDAIQEAESLYAALRSDAALHA